MDDDRDDTWVRELPGHILNGIYYSYLDNVDRFRRKSSPGRGRECGKA